MSISAQFLPQKISAHFQFHLLNLRAIHLGQLFVTPEIIAKKIKKMKDNKSSGVDGIPPKLLKEIVEQISTPLAKLFNLSLEEGIVPSEWKEANITPLFKKGSRTSQKITDQ